MDKKCQVKTLHTRVKFLDKHSIMHCSGRSGCSSAVVDELKGYGGISVHEFRVMSFLRIDVALYAFVR